MFNRIRGRGAYRSGGVVPFRQPGRMATFSSTGRGGCRIRHSEYLEDVVTGAAGVFYSEGGGLINPANRATFPWLSQIAQRFQEYEFNGLVFEYRTTSMDAMTTTVAGNAALGVVIGATEYNVTKSDFFTKQEMDNYEWVVSGKPSANLKFPVECQPQLNVLGRLYVDGSHSLPVGVSQDPRMSWLGKFQLGMSGFQAANVNIGELWVTYDVSLFKPAAAPAQATSELFGHYGNGTGIATQYQGLTGVTQTIPFGTQTPCSWNDNGSSVTSSAFGSKGQVTTVPRNYADYFKNSITNLNVSSNNGNIAIRDPFFRMGQAFTVLWFYRWSQSVTTPTMALNASTNCTSYPQFGVFDTGTSSSGVNWPGGAGTQAMVYGTFYASNNAIPLVAAVAGADPATNLVSFDLIVRALPKFGDFAAEDVPLNYRLGEDLKHGWLRKEPKEPKQLRVIRRGLFDESGDEKDGKDAASDDEEDDEDDEEQSALAQFIASQIKKKNKAKKTSSTIDLKRSLSTTALVKDSREDVEMTDARATSSSSSSSSTIPAVPASTPQSTDRRVAFDDDDWDKLAGLDDQTKKEMMQFVERQRRSKSQERQSK